jgi:hypothetical protein
MDWKMIVAQELTRAGGQARNVAAQAVNVASVKQGVGGLVRAAATLPTKELAIICGRAGAANAVVEGIVGTFHAVKAVNEGRIDGKQAVVHAVAEAGSGFVTSSAGTAGTLAAYMITGTMGPMAIAAGMGAGAGARYIYRSVIGDTLPPKTDA